ncbi:MAG: hypothetical protein KDA98_17375 [Acidimicrobiales bacterium]|nr:hypothetical protein [Acidimicrobiales bacterium]
MSRPTKFEDFRYVGDKRTQVVYDLDTAPQDLIDELMEAGTYLAFGPDTVVEARNRGYKPHSSVATEAE